MATLAPLYSKGVLVDLAEALNVPLSVVKKTFQKVVRELKDHLSLSTSLPLEGDEEATKSAAVVMKRSAEALPSLSGREGQERTVSATTAEKLDRSDGSDTSAVEELRALMNTRSGAVNAAQVKHMLNGEEDEEGDHWEGETDFSPRPPPEEDSEPFSARARADPTPVSEDDEPQTTAEDDPLESYERTTAQSQEGQSEGEEAEEEDYGDDFEDD